MSLHPVLASTLCPLCQTRSNHCLKFQNFIHTNIVTTKMYIIRIWSHSHFMVSQSSTLAIITTVMKWSISNGTRFFLFPVGHIFICTAISILSCYFNYVNTQGIVSSDVNLTVIVFCLKHWITVIQIHYQYLDFCQRNSHC